MKCIFFVLLCGSRFSLSAQTDYDALENWYYHPEKAINFISNYTLDIAVVNADLGIDSTITFANKSETNTGVDVFWVHPTQLTDPPFEPTVVPLNEQPFALISSTILAQGALLAKYGRFYAPRYQQATPAAFLDPTYPSFERAEALMAAYQDVKAAFENYLENHNNGNQIILAAHSQGSFLSAMLLRDLFDNDPALREQLLCAVLPGMPYVFANNGTYVGGQWENIPLCTSTEECGCIHAWRSFKETQTIPGLVFTLPAFMPELVDSGLVHRNIDLNEDWFVQDEMYYGEESTPLRFYIAPDAAYDLGGGTNFIAFDQYFSARMKRTSDTKVVLAVDYPEDENDLRPNDLLSQENGTGFTGLSFAGSGFHNKDYHIYLWALMSQIDAKLSTCAPNNISNTPVLPKNELQLIPGAERGVFQVKILGPISPEDELVITDLRGKIVQRIPAKSSHRIQLNESGCYLIRFRNTCLKMPVY